MPPTDRLLSADPNAAVLLSDDQSAGQPARPPDRPTGLATIGDQIQAKYPGAGQALRTATAGEQGKSSGDAATFLKEATAGLNPLTILDGLGQAFFHPINTIGAIGSAQDRLRLKGVEAFKRGDYITGARNFAEWMVPMLGPRLSQAGDYMEAGDLPRGLGATADVALQVAGPKLAGTLMARTPPVVRPNLTGPEAQAVAFGQSRGIPMDAATLTGSRHLRSVQKRLGGTVGGASVVERAQSAAQDALAATGGDLAEQAGTSGQGVTVRPQTPVSAGEGVVNALTKRVQDLHQQATQAYDALRGYEQAAEQRIAATGGQMAPPGSPMAFTTEPLAVDVRAAKVALQPMYQRFLREAQMTPGAVLGSKARALNALDRLMQAPDLARLSMVDDVLGELKGMARGAEMPELRTGGQATAAQMVDKLDAEVRAAAARGGPDVIKALKEGRAATKAKYATADVLDLLSDEPGKVFQQLTAGKDTALNTVRQVKALAPAEMPKVARAYIEQALEKATAEGGFKRTDGLFRDWQLLGGATKQELFGAALTKDLDNFFLLAKKMGADPNPAGTGTTLNALRPTELLGYLPTKVFAKILYSQGGARRLATGLRMSVNTSPAAWTAAMGQLRRAADSAGVALPSLADQEAEGQSR